MQWVLPLYSNLSREGLIFAVWWSSLAGKWGLTRIQKRKKKKRMQKNPELQAVKISTLFDEKTVSLTITHTGKMQSKHFGPSTAIFWLQTLLLT
jgi:hypothetical protein